MSALALWWHERSRREQRLLLVMVALLGLLFGWLLVVRPLGDALDDARRRHGEAVVALAEARARSGRGAGSSRAAPPLPIDSLIARTANEAGFAGARVTGRGPTRAELVIEAARPQPAFAWIGRLEAQGLVVSSLRARTNPDRTIRLEVSLRAGSGS